MIHKIFNQHNKLSIDGFISRCNKILPDNYVLWNHAFSTVLKERIDNESYSNIAFAPANDVVRDIIISLKEKNSEKICESNHVFPVVFDDMYNKTESFPVEVIPYEEVNNCHFDKIYIISHQLDNNIDNKLLSLGIKNEKIVNFMREYSIFLMDHLEKCAKEDCDEIVAQIKDILTSQPKEYIDHKIDSFIYYWMIDCHIKLFNKRDVNYYVTLAKLASGQGDHQRANDAVDHLISLNSCIDTSTLRNISFVLTYRCNLRCKHCWIYNEYSFDAHNMSKHVTRPELTLDEIVKIVKISEILHGTNITLTGGEALIRDDFKQILHTFADAGLKFEIFTNGTFPDRLYEIVSDNKIRSSIKSVGVSFDGDQEIVDSIRGKGVFGKLAKSIDILKSSKVKFRLNTVIMEQNIDNLDKVVQTAKDLGCNNQDFNLETQSGKYIGLSDIRQIKPYMYENKYFRILDEARYTGAGCLAGITRCSITPYGIVEACSTSKTFGHLIIGNLCDYDFNFDTLWTSNNAQKIRTNVRNCPGCANHCERG